MGPTRKTVRLVMVIVVLLGIPFMQWAHAAMAAPKTDPEGSDGNLVERGSYLSMIGGCHDCHTPGYLLLEGQVEEKKWLTGDRFGWRGPWGTTYAPNLRLFLKDMTEEQWLAFARTVKTRPPMPWFSMNKMHTEDLQAIYRFIRYLGPAGEAVPAYVPPGEEPKTPYALFPSPPKTEPK